MVKHAKDCYVPRLLAEQATYKNEWPEHCQRCGGWGGFWFYESDTGYQGVDPCPMCIEEGKCPRCGNVIPEMEERFWDKGEYAKCDECGYVEGETQGMPEVEGPCSCELDLEKYIPY